MIRKTFTGERKEDGWLVVNTATLDRDNDRVQPGGAVLDAYRKNPVVMYGHNYRDPWALIGKTAEIRASDMALEMKPELREPTGPEDPMTIIRALWDAGLLRAASVGFRPLSWEDNEQGGRDYTSWELLEWSLVPVPANSEALRLAVKGIEGGPALPETGAIECQADGTWSPLIVGDNPYPMSSAGWTGKTSTLSSDGIDIDFVPLDAVGDLVKAVGRIKRGRVLSARNEEKIRDAVRALQEVLSQLGEEDGGDDGGKATTAEELRELLPDAIAAKADHGEDTPGDGAGQGEGDLDTKMVAVEGALAEWLESIRQAWEGQ